MNAIPSVRKIVLVVSCFAAGFVARAKASEDTATASSTPIAIGTRVEIFVDDALIDSARRQGVSLQLQKPERREVVLTLDKPWEGSQSGYYTVFRDGPRVRLYYRGSGAAKDDSDEQVTCYAESTDGVHFDRPTFGLHEVGGSRANNIILKGAVSHNFAPFLDANPAAKPSERYKALSGLSGKLYAYKSADGIHWEKLQAEPVMTKGAFDSLNLAFWDDVAHTYRAYSRYFASTKRGGVRSIQHNESPDFIHWSTPEPNEYAADVPMTQFYTNATIPCPGAEHQLLAFPMRFVPERTKLASAKEKGVSDAMFMSSRDGRQWDRRFAEAWLRPGPDERNWTDRSNMPAWGIVTTGPDEFSMYVSEHYRWPDNRLRRVTVPRHRFASVHAAVERGEFTTRPLTFAGDELVLNYATSVAGSVQVEIQDEGGKSIKGYELAEMTPLFGDELEAVVKWGAKSDVAELAGKTVRLRFVMKDADLFALRTRSR